MTHRLSLRALPLAVLLACALRPSLAQPAAEAPPRAVPCPKAVPADAGCLAGTDAHDLAARW